MTITPPPLTPIGSTSGYASAWGVNDTGRYYVTPTDPNPKLRFPGSVTVWDDMRTSDGKVASTLAALTAPIEATRWRVTGDGVPEPVIAHIEQALGLDEDAHNARRSHGINWGEFLRHALLMLPLGFMAFEKVWTYDEGGRTLWLEELAPLMPTTITAIPVDHRGRLVGVTQQSANPAEWEGKLIPSGLRDGDPRSLLMFVNDREGADWSGRSVLRAAYKHWHLRDHLIRIGAQSVERGGMGIPVVTYDPNVPNARADAQALARSIRAGAEAGAAVPVGTTVTLLGVTGSVVDPIPQIEYHDRAIAAAALTGFLELGHTGGIGQGNVADKFADVYHHAVAAVVRNVEDTITRHLIRDLVDYQWGPDTPCPILKADPIDVETASADVLKVLTDSGLITPDGELETEVRRRYGLPAKPEPETIPAQVVPAPLTPPQAPAALAEDDDAATSPTDPLLARLEHVTATIAALLARHD